MPTIGVLGEKFSCGSRGTAEASGILCHHPELVLLSLIEVGHSVDRVADRTLVDPHPAGGGRGLALQDVTCDR